MRRVLSGVVAAAVCVAMTSCGGKSEPSIDVTTDAFHERVVAFCGACHAYPAPDVFPREYWPKEVKQGFGFFEASGRKDLDAPPFDAVVEYYVRHASDAPVFAQATVSADAPLRFEQTQVPAPADTEFPTVSFVRPTDAGTAALFADMSVGRLERLSFDGQEPEIRTLASVEFPAQFIEVDFDQDGHNDLLISDLGSFRPSDHTLGKVIWARWDAESASYQTDVLIKGLARVADVQALDLEGDGDLDLIVGEFGWRKSGNLLLFEQSVSDDGTRTFRRTVLDDRHGASHIRIGDLNGDQRPDFAVLMSQEHEVVMVFLGQDDGSFQKETVFKAGNPAYGSSGIELEDLDGDGDLDVLYSNGDTMDSDLLQPYHGIQWLENDGAAGFAHHRLTDMPGAFRAVSGDLDGDGDPDIIASAIFNWSDSADLGTLVWLEQIAPGEFRRHDLDIGFEGHNMALEIVDLDRDGRKDIVVGHGYAEPSPMSEDASWLTVWWNRGPRDK